MMYRSNVERAKKILANALMRDRFVEDFGAKCKITCELLIGIQRAFRHNREIMHQRTQALKTLVKRSIF
jgi:hypothetical protein